MTVQRPRRFPASSFSGGEEAAAIELEDGCAAHTIAMHTIAMPTFAFTIDDASAAE
jgi:hypothetical protein